MCFYSGPVYLTSTSRCESVYGLVWFFFIYLWLQNVHGLPLSAVFGISTATLNEKNEEQANKRCGRCKQLFNSDDWQKPNCTALQLR